MRKILQNENTKYALLFCICVVYLTCIAPFVQLFELVGYSLIVGIMVGGFLVFSKRLNKELHGGSQTGLITPEELLKAGRDSIEDLHQAERLKSLSSILILLAIGYLAFFEASTLLNITLMFSGTIAMMTWFSASFYEERGLAKAKECRNVKGGFTQ